MIAERSKQTRFFPRPYSQVPEIGAIARDETQPTRGSRVFVTIRLFGGKGSPRKLGGLQRRHQNKTCPAPTAGEVTSHRVSGDEIKTLELRSSDWGPRAVMV